MNLLVFSGRPSKDLVDFLNITMVLGLIEGLVLLLQVWAFLHKTKQNTHIIKRQNSFIKHAL